MFVREEGKSMIEGNPFLTEYNVLSPHERQNVLHGLVALIPSHTSGETVKSIPANILRRSNSETYKTVSQRLDALLGFSFTTEPYRERCMGGFSLCFWLGIARNNPLDPNAKLPLILGLNHKEAPGIFDREAAKEIESRAYQIAVREYLQSKQEREQIMQSDFPDYVKERAMRLLGADLSPYEEEFLSKWRSEFIKLHNDEP